MVKEEISVEEVRHGLQVKRTVRRHEEDGCKDREKDD
jgi:hypothetical protein